MYEWSKIKKETEVMFVRLSCVFEAPVARRDGGDTSDTGTIWCLHFRWVHCIRISTRRGICGEIWPEPKGVPEGAARGNSQGLMPYYTVYPESCPNVYGHYIISKSDFIAIFNIALRGGVILEELILRMSLSGRAILHCILPRDYIFLYAPCRGSVSWEIHFLKTAILEQLIFNISLLEMI